MADTFLDRELLLNQFNRLMQDVFRENVSRTCFHPWEIELLLDMQQCELRPSRKRELLRSYQKSVQRHLEKSGGTPPKLSEFIEERKTKRTATRAGAVA